MDSEKTGTSLSKAGSSTPESSPQSEQREILPSRPEKTNARKLHAQRFEEMLTTLFKGKTPQENAEYAKQISDEEIENIRQAQRELEDYLNTPPSEQFIARMLDVMAEVFQAQVPSADALSQWVKFLREYPQDAIRVGARALMRTHKWRSLPLPADFQNAIIYTQFWVDLKSERSMYELLLARIERLKSL